MHCLKNYIWTNVTKSQKVRKREEWKQAFYTDCITFKMIKTVQNPVQNVDNSLCLWVF